MTIEAFANNPREKSGIVQQFGLKIHPDVFALVDSDQIFPHFLLMLLLF